VGGVYLPDHRLEITIKTPSRFISLIVLITLLLSQFACSLPVKLPGKTQPENVTISLKSLVSQKVAPSEQEQSLAYEDKLNVVLPGGLLNQEDTLVISSLKNTPPPPSAMRKLMAAYDVSIGDQHTFDKTIRLEFNYDPKILKADIPASAQFTAAFWDTTQNIWVTVPSEVDENQHKIIVMTDHLSPYACFTWVAGYSLYPLGKFNIIYDKKKVEVAAGNYKSVVSRFSDDPPYFIQDIGDFLNAAYAGYQKAGFALPEGEINVEVGDYDASELGTLSGIIRITTLVWANTNELRQDCAHELFHAIQQKALGTTSYLSRHWWADATADYAADRVAYAPNSTGKMGIDIKPRYLGTTITSNEDYHAYNTSHFVGWLVDTQQVSSFKALWDATAEGGNDVLATLKKFIADPKPLGLHFSEFALFFIFDANSPGPRNKISAISTGIASQTDTLKPDTPELRQTFQVDYFTVRLWAIESAVDSDVIIERMDEGYGAVWVVVQDGDNRGAAQLQKPEEINGARPFSVHLKPGEYLYLMMDNTTDSESQAMDVRVTLSQYPIGVYTMNLTMDDGCDGSYNGDYNNSSSLHNIPVVINDKGKAAIDYDKTTGDKHLVATGSGSIDATGKLKLNFELAYTLTGTIGGEPVERGTETASGMVTAVWDPNLNQWVGTASGSLDANYIPFNEGKGSSCSAGITKAKLAPGFVDVDR
jgi:hypothetical protein